MINAPKIDEKTSYNNIDNPKGDKTEKDQEIQ